MNPLQEKIKTHRRKIREWLEAREDPKELPLYSSVDIRDAGFKAAVVDTNLFPAGFNNLCEHGQVNSVELFKAAINDRVSSCQNILIVAEEHTRNMWYLENIRVLEQIIKKAGFNVMVATFLYVQPEFCNEAQYVEVETAAGFPLRIHCFQRILREIKAEMKHFDLIILNNDLSIGIPDVLKNAGIPIYPSIQAGWHSRHKSLHFKYTAELMEDFAKVIDADPWFFSCLNKMVESVNINNDGDRQKLADLSAELIQSVKAKYREYNIPTKPYLFIKADSGTYGMGVLSMEDPNELIELNRRDRNRLYKGKGAQVISRFLLQEGVPTVHRIDKLVSEVCVYQIANNLAGAFYRSHKTKSERDNLNSQGMEFRPLCPRQKTYPDCGTHYDVENFELYMILGRIAALAAYHEILELEIVKK